MTEEFRKYDEHFEVSNCGNVKKDGKQVIQFKDEYYYNVSLYGKPKRVHEMVAECFQDICGEKKKYYHVHHKNRNQLDNRVENLIYLSPSEHRKMHQKEDGVSVAVKAYDLDGNFVGRWDSKMQAAEETNVQYRHITDIINNKGRRFTAGKLYWFKEEISEDEVKNKIIEIKAVKYEALRKKH